MVPSSLNMNLKKKPLLIGTIIGTYVWTHVYKNYRNSFINTNTYKLVNWNTVGLHHTYVDYIVVITDINHDHK